MATLEGQSIAASYDQLLHVDRDGGGNTTTHVSVKDGDNDTTFALTLATDAVMITSTNRLEFGDNGTYIHQSADGVLDLVSDTELELNATTIDINGAVDISGDTTIAGDVIMASGKGISFAAYDAGGPGATPDEGAGDILSDYETGTWTPVLKSNNNTISFSSIGTANYTKIGNLVTVSWSFLSVTTSGTPDVTTTIQGLPFTASGGHKVGTTFYSYGLNFDVVPDITQIEPSTTVVFLYSQTASGNYGVVTIDAVGAGSSGGFSISYYV